MNITKEIEVFPFDNGVVANNKGIIDSHEKCLNKVIEEQLNILKGSKELPYGDSSLKKPYKITIKIESI